MNEHFPEIVELKRLIMHTSTSVWRNDISDKQIEAWLDNFKGEVFDVDEERKIALWLLSNFVFYNEDEVKHLCKVLLNEFVHQMLLKDKTEGTIESKIQTILGQTKFFPLGLPSESGGFILYYFRKENDLHMSYFLGPSEEELKTTQNLVFLDDVTLTAGPGGQAYDFFKKRDGGGKNRILLTFIATQESISALNDIGINVITPIILDNRNKCFSDNSDIFHSYQSRIEQCKKFVLHYGNKLDSTMPLGYNDGQYGFGFSYNTPDNTLPIFWFEEKGWKPIFRRYKKNYKDKKIMANERFV